MTHRRRTREATADELGSARLLGTPSRSGGRERARSRREPGRLARPAAHRVAPGKARRRRVTAARPAKPCRGAPEARRRKCVAGEAGGPRARGGGASLPAEKLFRPTAARLRAGKLRSGAAGSVTEAESDFC